mmetsp:Transcript_152770/g.292591  ORF Transcript_152770/g.292591 Transcript_152770/m.292591 type:complete len:226 (+) Transcript_152770:89-766(+)
MQAIIGSKRARGSSRKESRRRGEAPEADTGSCEMGEPITMDEVRREAFAANWEVFLSSMPSRIRLIFLDVDGVLATRPRVVEHRCARLIYQLISATGASIVISSTWRYALASKQLLLQGLVAVGCSRTAIVGQTPDKNPLDRPDEIRSWIAKHWQQIQDVTTDCRYVVIDDWDLLDIDATLEPHFVRTHASRGFTAADLHKALRILDPGIEIEQPVEESATCAVL